MCLSLFQITEIISTKLHLKSRIQATEWMMYIIIQNMCFSLFQMTEITSTELHLESQIQATSRLFLMELYILWA